MLIYATHCEILPTALGFVAHFVGDFTNNMPIMPVIWAQNKVILLIWYTI